MRKPGEGYSRSLFPDRAAATFASGAHVLLLDGNFGFGLCDVQICVWWSLTLCSSVGAHFCWDPKCRNFEAYRENLLRMSEGKRVLDPDLEEKDVLRVDLDPENSEEGSTHCLIGKVLMTKTFNAFGFLESMKRAMAPAGGFDAREIDKNLFFFHFNSVKDMKAVLDREPWHFDKNVLVLQELGCGVQPAAIKFTQVAFWVRLYELPMGLRNKRIITLIAGKIEKLMEIDPRTLEGFGRSIRAKIRVDTHKPLKCGIHMELQGNKKIWIKFKYGRLPSFCYICAMLGHMRRECDLGSGMEGLEDLPETRLLFGEWIRASSMKKATVITEESRRPTDSSSLRRRLFEKFK
ncbi:hypothetical protein ACS0TY_029939 [Phlomoides rotata]